MKKNRRKEIIPMGVALVNKLPGKRLNLDRKLGGRRKLFALNGRVFTMNFSMFRM